MNTKGILHVVGKKQVRFSNRVRGVRGCGKTRQARFFSLHALLSTSRRRIFLDRISGGRRRLLSVYFRKHLGQHSAALRDKHNTLRHTQITLNCYKALRKTLGLPCNGQRTKSNARTSRMLSGRFARRKHYTLLRRRSAIRLRTAKIAKERKRKAKLLARSIVSLQRAAFGVKRKPKDRKKGMKEKLRRR